MNLMLADFIWFLFFQFFFSWKQQGNLITTSMQVTMYVKSISNSPHEQFFKYVLNKPSPVQKQLKVSFGNKHVANFCSRQTVHPTTLLGQSFTHQRRIKSNLYETLLSLSLLPSPIQKQLKVSFGNKHGANFCSRQTVHPTTLLGQSFTHQRRIKRN